MLVLNGSAKSYQYVILIGRKLRITRLTVEANITLLAKSFGLDSTPGSGPLLKSNVVGVLLACLEAAGNVGSMCVTFGNLSSMLFVVVCFSRVSDGRRHHGGACQEFGEDGVDLDHYENEWKEAE